MNLTKSLDENLIILNLLFSSADFNQTPLINKSDYLMKLGNKPCIRVRKIINKTIDNCTETCLSIRKIYRYGNNFISFRNAIGISLGTGMKRIIIEPNFLFLTENFYYESISIEVTKNDENCFRNHFFYINGQMKKLIDEQIPFLNDKFKSFYSKLFPQVVIPNDSLVIHMRSNDVFYFRVHKGYGQPPCSYYIDVIKQKNWSKVILISQDRRNPCVRVVEKYTEKVQRRTFQNDFALLLNARNLVASHSTLTKAVSYLSQKLENFYIYNETAYKYVNTYKCVATEEYFNRVLKYWANNRSQKALMMNSPSCVQWIFYPKVSLY